MKISETPAESLARIQAGFSEEIRTESGNTKTVRVGQRLKNRKT